MNTEKNHLNFQAVLEELTRIKIDRVEKIRDWYNSHAPRPMRLFRATGVIIILLSVSLPYLITLEEAPWDTVVVPIIALLIAGLTGINSFFNWQGQWKNFRTVQHALEHHLGLWDLEIVKAKQNPNEEEAISLAVKATSALVQKTRKIIASEERDFFESVGDLPE